MTLPPPRRLGLCLLLLGLAGCGRDRARYAEAIKEHLAVQEEIVAVLKTVRDEASMKEAQPRLERLFRSESEAIARLQALPPPKPEAKEQLVKELGGRLRDTVGAMAREAERIGRLPGGAEFLESLGQRTPGLGAPPGPGTARKPPG